MVRRLVEEQEIWGGEEQAAEGYAAALASRERGHILIARGQSQRLGCVIEDRVEVPGVLTVDLILNLALLLQERVHLVVGHRLGEASRELVEAVEQVAQGSYAVLDVAPDVFRLVELGLLFEEPHGGLRCKLRHAARGLLAAGHDP